MSPRKKLLEAASKLNTGIVKQPHADDTPSGQSVSNFLHALAEAIQSDGYMPAVKIAKLSLKSYDVVVVRSEKKLDSEEQKLVHVAMNKLFPKNKHILLSPGIVLEKVELG